MNAALARQRTAAARERVQRVPVGALVVALVFAATIAAVYPDRSYPAIPVFVGLTLASLVLLVDSRVWALAPLLLVEFSASDYINPQLHVSARLAVLLIVALVSLPILARQIRLNSRRVRAVLLPAIILVFIATARNALVSDPAYVIKYARYMGELLLTLVVTLSVVRNRMDARKVAWLALGLGVANGMAAVLQHYMPHAAPYIAASYATFDGWDGRSIGLTDSPVLLGITLPFVLVPLLGMLFTLSDRRGKKPILLLLGILALGIGLYFTYTRSVMIGVATGMLTIAWYLHGQRRTVLLGLIVGAAVMFELLQGTGLIGARYYSLTDSSAESHKILWIADFQIALANSLIGIGNGNYQQAAADYTGQVSQDVSARAQASLSILGTEQPHNDFLYVWLSWGIVALAAYVMVFVGALRNFTRAARSDDPAVRRLAIGCAGGLVAYAVNSAFHNYLDSSTLLWLYAGFSVALARIADATPRAAVPRTFRARRRAWRAARRAAPAMT